MAYYPNSLLMLPGTLVVPLREHHWPPTKRTDIDDSHTNVLLSLSVFWFFLNSNEVISLFCEKRQKKLNQYFQNWDSMWMGISSGPVVGTPVTWKKSESQVDTANFRKKTIVMFYVNCSEKKFSEKRKWASPLRPLGAKWMRTFQVGLFSRVTDLRWGKGETNDISRKQDESRRAGGTQTWPARWTRVGRKKRLGRGRGPFRAKNFFQNVRCPFRKISCVLENVSFNLSNFLHAALYGNSKDTLLPRFSKILLCFEL